MNYSIKMCNAPMSYVIYLSDDLDQENVFEGQKEFTLSNSNQVHSIFYLTYLSQYSVKSHLSLNI